MPILQTTSAFNNSQADALMKQLINMGVSAGKSILIAILVFVVGRYVVKLLNRVVAHMLERSKVDPAVQTFVRSLVNILLTILLVISVISALGIETTSFAALLASAGVAIGMALSGQLQNFAGDIIILLFKPYRVGDYIESEGIKGTVEEIQIFHTVIRQYDNRMVYFPNGKMSSAAVINYSRQKERRLQWIVAISYGEDVEHVRQVIIDILSAHPLIIVNEKKAPLPIAEVESLGDSCVNILARAWTKTEDYWTVNFDINRQIYTQFNKLGIIFPFPQTTIHIAKD